MFMDNHRSHLSPEISKLCEDNSIHLIGLHPNGTHLHQPLDVAVFKPFKVIWDRMIAGPEVQVVKTSVCSLVGRVMESTDFTQNVKSGFRSAGLHPLDKNAIDRTKIITQPIVRKAQIYVHGVTPPLYLQNPNLDKSIRSASPESAHDDGLQVGDPLFNYNFCDYDSEPEIKTHSKSLEQFESPTAANENQENGVTQDRNVSNPKRSNDDGAQVDIQMFDSVTTTASKPALELTDIEVNDSADNERCGNQLTMNRDPISRQLNFTSHFEFECAAKRYAFKQIQGIYGPQLCQSMDSGEFKMFSTNDFALSQVYNSLRPPSSLDEVLSLPSTSAKSVKPMPVSWFCDENLAHSTEAARNKFERPSNAQIKKAQAVEERQKKRELDKLDKEEKAKRAKAEKQEEKLQTKKEKQRLAEELKQNQRRERELKKREGGKSLKRKQNVKAPPNPKKPKNDPFDVDHVDDNVVIPVDISFSEDDFYSQLEKEVEDNNFE